MNAVAQKRYKTFVPCARFQPQWLLFTVPFGAKFKVIKLRTVSTKVPKRSLRCITTDFGLGREVLILRWFHSS